MYLGSGMPPDIVEMLIKPSTDLLKEKLSDAWGINFKAE